MPARRKNTRGGGFTAFEALLAAAILAILTAAVSGALMAGRQESKLARDTVYASTLAHALMDEVMRLPVTDPLGSPNLGPDAGESRTTFNCVKDYAGYADGPDNLADLAGNLYPSDYQCFGRAVSMEPVSYTPQGWGRTLWGLKVTVQVWRDGRELVRVQRFACR